MSAQATTLGTNLGTNLGPPASPELDATGARLAEACTRARGLGLDRLELRYTDERSDRLRLSQEAGAAPALGRELGADRGVAARVVLGGAVGDAGRGIAAGE